jgi:hypothetical protein
MFTCSRKAAPVSDDPRKEFNALRFSRMDQLRRDHEQTAAARIVGAELFANLNSVSGQAWTSQAILAARLGFDLKTVKRSIYSLDGKYFRIERTCGAVNYYTPIWRKSGSIPADEPLLIASSEGDTGGKKGLGTRDKNGPGTGGKKGLVSLSRYHSNIPARVAGDWRQSRDNFRAARSALKAGLSPLADAAGIQEEAGENLKGQRDDGSLDLKAIEMFNGAGLDGLNIVSALHEIDDGLPRLRLFRLIRGGIVTPNDLTTAALAVREYESRKTRPAPINAKRTQGGAT